MAEEQEESVSRHGSADEKTSLLKVKEGKAKKRTSSYKKKIITYWEFAG